jgi:predicted ATPase
MLLHGYRIDRVLGEGGFGIVYLAFDAGLDRHVAIKEYLPSSMAARAGDGLTVVVKSASHAETFEIGLRSFVNEARLLARFDHPALIKVHQFWEGHGTAYMAMPFYEGPTLRGALATLGRPPTEDELRPWLMPLLDALEVLHKDNCFHRDIAPDNILITAGGPLLLDFGAARRVIGDLTHALTAMLKPGFAPIEQYGELPGMEQGPWTDLYALASVLYGAIAGTRVSPSVERLVEDRVKPLAQVADGRFRPAYLAAIDQALAVWPQHRPRSVAEFRALLLADAPVPAAPAAPAASAFGLPATVLASGPMGARALALSASNPNNLPRQRTSFVGRETELAEIKRLLGESALVTLLGMGGLGKTRLAQQVATELLPSYADGAWFVDLSAVTDPALVVGTLARTFEIFDEPGRPIVDSVCAWLRSRRLLIVLDNCEHVIGAAAELADAILAGTTQVQMLATSREVLDVPGEQSYPILPLPLPQRDASAVTVLDSPAVRMFADRARSQQPGFSLEAQDPALLAELLNGLEGIPLAIELAAARLRALSMPELVAGLQDRYALLTGGSRVLQRRQQTLRALVDWSYDSLDAAEQRLFARLAVFAGGFDTAAAKAVCADEAVPAALITEVLASLMQKSLVGREGEGNAPRYRMLETLRDYARDKLFGLDPAGATAARHGLHFFALAKEAARGMHGADQGQWARRLETELENLRAAIAFALSGGADPTLAVKLAVALTGFWMLRGHVTEGRKLVAAALALPGVQGSDLARAWALYTGGTLAAEQGDHVTATAQFTTCLELRRGLGNPVEIAATLSTLAMAHLQAGDPDAATRCESEALELFSKADDFLGRAIGHLHLAQIHLWVGDAGKALEEISRSLGLSREIGNREIEAACELAAAEAHLLNAREPLAASAVTRSLQLCQEATDRRGEASAHWWLGRLALEAGDLPGARAPLQRALRDFRANEMRAQMLGCLDDFVRLLQRTAQPAAALELASAVDEARRRFVLSRSPREERHWRARVDEITAALPDGDAAAAAKHGRSWELDQAVRTALGDAA